MTTPMASRLPAGGAPASQFEASIDEDAVQQWRRRSENSEPGAHFIELPLKTVKPSSRFPAALRTKMHDEYIESYLTGKVGVAPSSYNTRLARHSWPIRMEDTEITATFKARGNQDDKLFMTPSVSAMSVPRKQLIKGDDVLRVNLVAKPVLPRAARRAKPEADHSGGLEGGGGVARAISSFGEFKQKFMFPFCLRSNFYAAKGNRMASLRDDYMCDLERWAQLTLPL